MNAAITTSSIPVGSVPAVMLSELAILPFIDMLDVISLEKSMLLRRNLILFAAIPNEVDESFLFFEASLSPPSDLILGDGEIVILKINFIFFSFFIISKYH